MRLILPGGWPASEVQKRLQGQKAEVAHLKMTLSPDACLPGDIAVVNLVRNDFVPELPLRMESPVTGGQLIINLLRLRPIFLEQWFVMHFPKSQVAAYFGAQLVGAFVGASMLYFIFGDALIAFEKMNNIVRGQPGCAGHAARNWHSRNPKSQSEPGPPELLLNRSQKTRHDNSHSKCKLTHITNSQSYDEAI